MADTWVQQADANASSTGTGALTLAQAALLEKDILKAGVLEIFTAENPILQRLPFMDIAGNSLMYDYEQGLPAVGFRSVNEGYGTSHGRVAQRSVGLAIFGGDLDVDKFIIQTRSSTNDQRAIQESMLIKAMSYQWLKYFFDGDRAASSNEEFDGVNILLADTYHAPTGAAKPWDMDVIAGTATGYVASAILDHLDEALDAVIGPNSKKVILVNKTTHRWLTKLARANGQIDISVDQWGYQVERYSGVPIIDIEVDAAGNEILGFDEAADTNLDTASFYVARFEPGYIQGLQNGGMDVRDMGELPTAPVMRTRVEWFCALALMHPRAIKRVRGLDAVYA